MSTLPSGLPEQIADEEELARFLLQTNRFSKLLVKPAAFLPNPKDHETSVSRHGSTPVERLWQLGLGVAGSMTLYGAAIIRAKDVRIAGLSPIADEPPPFHAVIRNWPWLENDPQLQKAQQLERAQRLASAAGPPILRQE